LGIAAVCVSFGCATTAPKTLESFDTRDADVYLVPIGDFAPKYLIDLASYYEGVFPLRIGITPPLPYHPALFDLQRQQLVAQAAIGLIMETYDGYSSNADAIFIGVTHIDMYIQGKSWRFAYAMRIGDHHAVVTSARTTRQPQPRFSEITEVHPGLRKMVTKTIGLLYYEKPLSSNPRSVLYRRVLGLDDLESINESTVYSDILGQP